MTLIFQKWLRDFAAWYGLLRAIKAFLEKLAAATDARNRGNTKNIELHCVENLKPRNRLLASKHNLKITYFGADAMMKGTPGYQAYDTKYDLIANKRKLESDSNLRRCPLFFFQCLHALTNVL